MQYRGLFRCGWSEVEVRRKCRGLKRAVVGRMSHHIADGRKGRRRLAVQAAEPRRGVRAEVDVRHKCRALKRVVFWRMSHHIADGRKGRRRHADRAAEPARIEELPAKIKHYGK